MSVQCDQQGSTLANSKFWGHRLRTGPGRFPWASQSLSLGPWRHLAIPTAEWRTETKKRTEDAEVKQKGNPEPKANEMQDLDMPPKPPLTLVQRLFKAFRLRAGPSSPNTPFCDSHTCLLVTVPYCLAKTLIPSGLQWTDAFRLLLSLSHSQLPKDHHPGSPCGLGSLL